MTRLKTQFSVKGISLLNSVMASSSSVQFKYYLCNEVDDIAGNEQLMKIKRQVICIMFIIVISRVRFAVGDGGG